MAAGKDDPTQETVTAAVGSTRDWSGPTTKVDGPGPERELPPGTKVDRYSIVDTVGRGGMGVVYRAHDPELDRQVALKLLRVKRSKNTDSAQARGRLLREAQALAKLSHPNVVAVHDAGTYRGAVFLAMELVEGRDLGRWVRRHHPPRRAIINAYVAAGRGLAAAHAAGIVHRDFKPSNVLRGKDGRVRVVDFGLAKPVGADPVDEDMLSTASVDSGTEGILTRAGQIVGTPKYMALEQMTAKATGEHADQFSFCVALWEALYGERPYTGRTLRELGENMRDHAIREPPKKRRVPRWLRRTLTKGLSPAPEDRHPSMTALLDIIESVPRQRRRVATAAAGVAALGAVALGFALVGNTQEASTCSSGDVVLASAWSDARQRAVSDAFQASGRHDATEAFNRFRQLGDRFASRWDRMQSTACRAHRDGARSDRHYDLQVQCLEQKRQELEELTARYRSNVDSAAVDRAIAAIAELRDLEACADPTILASAIEPPAPSDRQAVEDARRSLARAEVLRLAGEYPEATAAANDAVARARAAGYGPVLAEALVALGRVLEASGERERAVKAFSDATEIATAAEHDRAAAEAWISLLWNAGYVARERQRAELAELAAKTAVVRAGGGPELESALENTIASTRYIEGKLDDALPRFERVIELRRRAHGNDAYQLAGPLTNMGLVYYRKGEYAKARGYHERAVALRERHLGPRHPELASPLNNLGITCERVGEFDAALEHYRRALAIRESVFGRAHRSIGGLVNNIGNIYLRRDEPAVAERYLRRALAIKRAAHGDSHPRVATSLDNLAEALLRQRQYEAAIAAAVESLAITRKHDGEDHPDTAYALTHLGNGHLGAGRLRPAHDALTRALSLREKHAAPPSERAESRFALARVEWALGRRARARESARVAVVELRQAGDASKRDLARVQAWLADNAGK